MKKHYLSVAYDDRELAKRLGARWDPSVRRWYCTPGSPLAKIFTWRAASKTAPESEAPTPANSDDSGIEINQAADSARRIQPIRTTRPAPQAFQQALNFELPLAG